VKGSKGMRVRRGNVVVGRFGGRRRIRAGEWAGEVGGDPVFVQVLLPCGICGWRDA